MVATSSMLRNVDRMSLYNIDQSKVCDRRREFEQYLSRISKSTQEHYTNIITDLDKLEEKAHSGGCAFYYLGIEIKFYII